MWTRLGLLTLAFLVLAAATAVAIGADPAPGIPPDGPAGPVRSLGSLLTTAPLGTAVTTQPVTVVEVSCPDCASATRSADFTIQDGEHTMRVHVENTWQARYNVKKQNFVPEVGQEVVVQGRLQQVDDERYIQLKRFGLTAHEGPTVSAYDIASGRHETGTYVWLAPVQVLNVARWDDGDFTFDVRDPSGGGIVHLELAPPFQSGMAVPRLGTMVEPYGMIRWDPDNGWWEIHPVRCWRPGECVDARAAYVQNGPPAGTPESGGHFLEGGPVPLWLPRSDAFLGAAAVLKPSASHADWLLQNLFLGLALGGLFTAAVTAFLRARFARLLSTGVAVFAFVWLVASEVVIGYVTWIQPTTGFVAAGVAVLAWRRHGLVTRPLWSRRPA